MLYDWCLSMNMVIAIKAWFFYAFREVGAWRSLVARQFWELEVAGSNPVAPTIFSNSPKIPSLLRHKPIDSKSRRLPLSLFEPLGVFGHEDELFP